MTARAMPCANTPTQNESKIQKSLNSRGSAVSAAAMTSGPIARFQPCGGGIGGASPCAPRLLRRSISNASERRPLEEKL